MRHITVVSPAISKQRIDVREMPRLESRAGIRNDFVHRCSADLAPFTRTLRGQADGAITAIGIS